MYTLLIADDERLECDAIELLVNRANLPIRCIKAKNGAEAVQLSKQYNPDIAFLDIRMPGIDGIEAGRQIKELNGHCHVVFLTAWSSFEFAQQAIRLGASEYLVKPVQRKDVYELLDTLLSQIEEQKLSEEQHNGEIREVLNLFSREFFASLKFGRLSEEALKSYFTMQGITIEEGVALVIGGIEEQELHSFFQNSRLPGKLQMCYFPSVDRITVLVFTNQPSKIVEQLASYQGETAMSIGSGMYFTELTGIPQSISTASLSYTQANHLHMRFQRFTDVVRFPKDTKKVHENTLSMISYTLDGELGKARTLAHEIIDTIEMNHESEENAIQELYEVLMVFLYELNKTIPLFNQLKPQKTSIMEQEIYLMDLIDTACSAVQEDRQDRYSRPFKFVDQYVHSHMEQPLSVESVAKIIGLNTKYFSQLCKSYLGATFVEYLTNVRMEKAKQLLSEGTLSVKEIAETTGFLDGNYFSRVFRNYYGKTPSSFREEREKI